MQDLKSLYPELEKYDGLPFALQSELSKVIPDLKIQSGISFSKLKKFAEEFERHGIYHSSSVVIVENGKSANVDVAIEQKLYILTLSSRDDKPGAFLEMDTFDQVVSFLSVWLGTDKSIAQLENIDHYKTFLNLEDDAQYIRWQWASRHRQAVNFPSITGLLAPLFYQAMNDPVLSQVTPYTSLTTLFLSRCTEFPFLSRDYPLASPAYSIGHYYKYVVQKQNLEEAKKLILQLPSDVGTVVKIKRQEYEFTNVEGKNVFRGNPINLLQFIIEFTNERYDVVDRMGNGLVTENAKQAVEFLRNALPSNWHRSIRGSADDL